MSKEIERTKDAILEALLPEVPFDGWSWQGVRQAAVAAGYDKAMARAVFPGKLNDVLAHFTLWVDRQMFERLADIDPEELRIRDRIKTAVMARFEVLAPYKEAEKLALSYWSLPQRSIRAGKVLWGSADRIWDWAGDTAKDYNRYTKRGLLSGVMGSTMLVWIEDESEDMAVTSAFLDRRIENVMQLGRIIGKIKKAA